MLTFEGKGIGDFYYSLYRYLFSEGRAVTVRGQRCYEAREPVVLRYNSPGYCWMLIPGRKFNPFFALAEVVWILSGRGDVKFISTFKSSVVGWADPGQENFHGAYGLRMRHWPFPAAHRTAVEQEINGGGLDQISRVIGKLQRDPTTRQAVISTWDPIRDNTEQSFDYPCNNVIYFSLRDGVLDESVVIRSNDLVWGVPYNAVQFTHLLAYVAGMLRVKMGKITYFIQNLHYYVDLYPESIDAIHNAALKAGPGALVHPYFSTVSANAFFNCKREVEAMVSKIGRLDSLGPEDFLPLFREGYWGDTILRMLWIYLSVKFSERLTEGQLAFLTRGAKEVQKPFLDLILDFYQGSKNSVAIEFASELGKK